MKLHQDGQTLEFSPPVGLICCLSYSVEDHTDKKTQTHLLQGLQILLSVRKNPGLHLQIVSLFFEPEEKRRNHCHNLDREENKEKNPLQGGWKITPLRAWRTATAEEKTDLVYI